MTNKTLISVIIPMYNVVPYLEKCVDSVYNQGLKEEEFEVILVNDGSLDNSEEVAKTLTKDKTNVKIISQANKGLGGARNTGIANASGSYLLFLDADDWFLPRKFPLLLIKTKNISLDILEFGSQDIDLDQKIINTNSVKSEILNGIEYYQNTRYMNSSCNKLYNTSFIRENNLQFMEKIYLEDYEFNTRAYFFAKRTMATDIIVAQFFQSSNSITRNKDKWKIAKMQIDIISVIEKTNEFYKSKQPTSKTTSAYFQQRLSFLTATLFYQLIKNKSPYEDFVVLRKKLKDNNLYFIDFPIFDMKKNWFRLLVLKHFFVLKTLIKILN